MKNVGLKSQSLYKGHFRLTSNDLIFTFNSHFEYINEILHKGTLVSPDNKNPSLKCQSLYKGNFRRGQRSLSSKLGQSTFNSHNDYINDIF